MASCLPHPIPNPSRPRESKGSALASISHLGKVHPALRFSCAEVEVEAREQEEKEEKRDEKQTDLTLCINRCSWEQVRPKEAIMVLHCTEVKG